MFGNAQGVPHWWRRRHVVYRPGPDSLGDQEHDISHAELGISVDSLLQSGLRSDQVSVSKNRVRRHGTEYTREAVIAARHVSDLVSPRRLQRLLDDGCTAILANCEEWVPRCSEVAMRLRSRFNSDIEAHVFITGRLAQGLSAHADGEDNLLVQLSGSKSWKLWRTEETSGRYFTDETELGPPTAEVDLSAGDALYIPVGWAHSGRASSHGSVHITYQVIPNSAADVLLNHVSSQLPNEISSLLAPCDPTARESLIALSGDLSDTVQTIVRSWAQQQESVEP